MKTTLLALCFFLPMLSPAQLVIDIGLDPVTTTESIFLSNGIFTSGITFSGSSEQFGLFDGSASTIGLNEGIVLSTGDASNAMLGGQSTSATSSPGGDVDLELLTGWMTYDLSAIEFDFIATGDSMNFQFVFASNEYLEFVGSNYNDVFGFFVSGPGIMGAFSNNATNIAVIPGTSDYISINTLNDVMNSAYYVYNSNWDTHQCDGFSTVLNASIGQLQLGEVYHIKIAITDTSDGVLDSWVFLGGESFEQLCTVSLLDEQERGGQTCMVSNVHANAVYSAECGTIELQNESEMNIAFTSAYYLMGDDASLPLTGSTQSYTYSEEGEYPIWLVYEVGEFRSQAYVGTMNIAFDAPPAPVLSVSEGVIQITNYDGVTPLPDFQWFLNGQPIAGATGTSYAIVESGFYSVTATAGCPSQSQELDLLFVGIPTLHDDRFSAYPNPASGPVTIQWKGEPVQLELFNMLGELVLRTTAGNTPVVLDELSAGSYLISIRDSSGMLKVQERLVVIR